MKVLVTGATGFLGSWLVRRLVRDGLDVSVLRRKSSDTSELTGLKVEHCYGDVTDLASVMAAVKDKDSVFHLAGLVAYTRAQRQPMAAVNVQGTAHVLQACKAHSVRRLLHLSSVVAVGASFDGRQPLTEESPYNLSHLNLGYFETKRDAELLVLQAVKRGDIDAVMINPSTIYGPGDAKKGSRTTQVKVAQGRFPFYTHGGVNVVAVEDVIESIVQGWQKGRCGERYIIAGENILIRDLFAMIAQEAGVKPPQIPLPTPAVRVLGHVGDLLEKIGKKGPVNSETSWTSTLFHWFDSSKAQNELGLLPKPAQYGIAQSVNWMKENGIIGG